MRALVLALAHVLFISAVAIGLKAWGPWHPLYAQAVRRLVGRRAFYEYERRVRRRFALDALVFLLLSTACAWASVLLGE